MKSTHCPNCATPMNMSGANVSGGAFPVGNDQHAIAVDLAIHPDPGDAGVCVKCGAIHVYTEDLDVRAANQDDDVPEEAYQFQQQIQAVNPEAGELTCRGGTSGAIPYWQCRDIRIYHGNCRDILPQLPALPWPDLLLTDPPYGAGLSFDYADRFQPSRKPGKAGLWWNNADRSSVNRHEPVVGDNAPFDPAHLLRFGKMVLWGANHYASRLPDSGGWIVWDKRRGIEDAAWPMSEAELAWTNLGKGVRFFRHRWFGLIRDSEQGEHFHPTQKPVALMRWIIEKWTKPGALVIDPYCGSGPVLLAAQASGRSAIGIEIEEKYCEIAAKRLRGV